MTTTEPGTGTAFDLEVRRAEQWAHRRAHLDNLTRQHSLDDLAQHVGTALIQAADQAGVVAYSQVRGIAAQVGVGELEGREALARLARAGFWTGVQDGLQILGGDR